MADDHIKVKLPQLPLYSGTVKNEDMVYVWEDATGVLKHATVGQLPFGQGGGGGQPLVGSPFKVRLGDDQVTISGGNTIVSDARLAGKTDYPVSSSQLNNSVFRDFELSYDSVNGSVTILSFELQPGEVLVLYPDGVAGSGSSGGALQPILDRLAALEAIVAPFVPSGSGENYARVWWTGGVENIPIGWVEDTDWRDFTPIHAPSPANIGNTVGANTRKLTTGQQGSFQVSAVSDRTAGAARNNATYNFSFNWGSGSVGLNAGSGANVPIGPVTVRLSNADDDIDMRQKSKYGIWIKYVGI